MTTELIPQPSDPVNPNKRTLSRALLVTLLGVGAALLVAIVVLIAVILRGGSDQDPVAGVVPVPSGSATSQNGATPSPTGSASPLPGNDNANQNDQDEPNSDDNASNDGDPNNDNDDSNDNDGDPQDDGEADGGQDDGGGDGPPISLLGVSSITITGPDGISLDQVCTPGHRSDYYGVNQDKQPAVLSWSTTGAIKTTLSINGTLVFSQPVNGSYKFVFDCYTNTGSPNTWRFEVRAADEDLNVKTAVVYANVNGATDLQYE